MRSANWKIIGEDNVKSPEKYIRDKKTKRRSKTKQCDKENNKIKWS